MKLARKLYFLFFLSFLAFHPMTGQAQERPKLDMTNLGKAWEDYTANPGKETAVKLYEILPDGQVVRGAEVQAEVRELINQKLYVLETQIYRGDRESLKVAFRLFTIADSEMQKSLAKIIGYLLRFDTRLFLEELMNYESLVPDLELVVCSFKLSAPGDISQQTLEKNIRLKALGYIDDKELKDIKKKCIKILNKVKLE
jgi:hypothetical protein